MRANKGKQRKNVKNIIWVDISILRSLDPPMGSLRSPSSSTSDPLNLNPDWSKGSSAQPIRRRLSEQPVARGLLTSTVTTSNSARESVCSYKMCVCVSVRVCVIEREREMKMLVHTKTCVCVCVSLREGR